MLGAGCSLVSPCTQSLGYGPSQNVAAAPEDVGLRGGLWGLGPQGFGIYGCWGFRVLGCWTRVSGFGVFGFGVFRLTVYMEHLRVSA